MSRFIRHIIPFAFCLLPFAFTSAQETQKLYLSGTGNDNTIQWDFMVTGGMNAGKWSKIAVPSNWELQGFGKYDYGFAKDSVRGKEQGLYKHTFTVPSSWKGKRVNIVFKGSMTDTEVKINGKSAGPVHQGAFYAFKYDITDLLNYGALNTLEATVSKHSANPSVNEAERKADFWIFGGIFRPVFLEALPQSHIERVAIDAKADGALTAKVFLNGSPDKLSLQLFSSNGKKMGKQLSVHLSSVSEAVLSGNFKSPDLWSSEFPNLYKAVFTLYKDGKAVHTISEKIGFRTIEVKERDGIYVNGVKIKIKGVNRHSFWPTSGRTTSKALSIKDVNLMKDMNMNAVRMAHYPPDDHFLDVCDSLGLFVMDELAGWHGHYDTPTGTKLVKEMIAHDVNHPSIILWANGNEGGHNRDLDVLFTQEDIQKRPVLHPWEDFGGFDTQHYREYNYGIGNYMHGHSIVLPTEFLHGQFDGGHGASLDDYWKEMLYHPHAAGGFLWDFADQGVVRTDKNGELDTDKFRGADGIVGPYHEKEGSFFTIKEVWSPVFFEHRDMTAAFDGNFNIENRYYYTNLNQVKFSWKLVDLQNASATTSGTSVSPDLKPFEKGTVKVELPAGWQDFDVLYITATDPHQRELFTWSFPITLPKEEAANIVAKNGNSKISIQEADTLYRVSVNNINLAFSKRTGILQSVRNAKGVIPLTNGPIVQEGATNFQNIRHRMDGENLIIESTFDRKSAYNTLQWTVYPSGWIKLNVKYFPAEYLTSFVGVNFSFPESKIKGVEYMGNGPYRVWKNRIKGNQFGIWNKTYNNTETGEQWIYPEFKGYHSNMYWCKFITTEQPFTVVTENEDLFLRLFTPAWKTDQWHNYEPIFPSGDISFMHGIPGIGTKTQRSDRSGPSAMKNVFYDYEKEPARALDMTLYFDFSGK